MVWMGKRFGNSKGAALILVLLLVPILVFLARSLAWLSRSSHFRSRHHHDRLAQSYVLEAGLAHASNKLIANATWTEGFTEEPMTRLDASYSVIFQDPSDDYQDGNSVNNLLGTEFLDGPRGPATVVPGTVELVILAQKGSNETRGQFILKALHDDSLDYALAAGRSVVMRGDVSVDGVINTRGGEVGPDGETGSGIINDDTWRQVDAGLHANQSESGLTAVSWSTNDAGDQAHFSGKVSTPTVGPTAFNFEGTEGIDYSVREFEDGATSIPISSPDIEGEVLDHITAQDPPVVAFGTTRLTSQDFYSDGDLDLQGDLVLEEGRLYVNGDLNINGSIRGVGSVYVVGATNFKGTAEVQASSADGVSVFSQGPISLTGFDGVEFMDELRAQNPEIDEHYRTFDEEMAEASDTTPDGSQRRMAERAADAIEAVSNAVHNQVPAGSETSDFVRDQLAGFSSIIEATHADGTYSRREMRGVHNQIRYGLDRLGTAFFSGKLVSNSFIHTDNAAGVIGVVWSSGQNTDAEPLLVGDVEVRAGDIYLGEDSSILMNQEILEDRDPTEPQALQGLSQISWYQ